MGTATYEYNISLYMTLNAINSNTDDEMIKKESDFLLSILPQGTKYLGHTWLPVVSLSKTYVMAFEHNLFENGTKISLDWVREAYVEDPNGPIKQLNVFLGVKYFKPDGTLKYKYP